MCVGGSLKGLHEHHDQTPANGVENPPGGGIVGAHGDNIGHQPEIERVPDGRLGKGHDTRSHQHPQCFDAGPRDTFHFVILSKPEHDPKEIAEAGEGGSKVTGEPDTSLSVDRRVEGADVEVGNEEKVEGDVDDKARRADEEGYVGVAALKTEKELILT
jgi:hypothetical protein